LGYHNYKTAATTIPKQFTASLTVEDTVCGTSKTATQTVTINCNRLLGKVKVATGAATGCEGATQKFVIEPVLNAYEKSGYGWFPPTGALVSKAGILPADTATTRNITFSTTGPFKIEAYNDCGKVDTTINLVITPKPTSNFTFVLSPSFKADFTATFNLTPAATTTYAWTFGDVSNNTASGITASHTYPSAGSYNACLTVTNTCGTSTQTCKTVAPTVTSLRDQDYVGVLRVYPTLTSTTLNVEVKGTANLQIKNLSGITLLEKTVQDAGSVDVSSLSAGMYLIAISQNGEVMVKQFVKQ
jgi:PKD repeat protein